MPSRAFIPGPLSQAQPRVYKSFRGRQLKGLLLAGTGVVVGLVIFGVKDVSAYGATFLLAVPGFAYGYFQPEGKPVEYWLLVQMHYHFTSQRFGDAPRLPGWRAWLARGQHMARAARRAQRLSKHEEVLRRG